MWTAAERAQRIDDSSHQALSDFVRSSVTPLAAAL